MQEMYCKIFTVYIHVKNESRHSRKQLMLFIENVFIKHIPIIFPRKGAQGNWMNRKLEISHTRLIFSQWLQIILIIIVIIYIAMSRWNILKNTQKLIFFFFKKIEHTFTKNLNLKLNFYSHWKSLWSALNGYYYISTI